MPYYRITMTERAYADPTAILNAVREANASAGYSSDDVFLRLEILPPGRLVIDPRYPGLAQDRTAGLIVFDILTSHETPEERRLRIRASSVDSLGRIGVASTDLIVFFVNYDCATTSFEGDKAPPPIHYTS